MNVDRRTLMWGLAVAGLLATLTVILVARASRRGTDEEDDETALWPVDQLQDLRSPSAIPPASAPGTIDLIDLIQISKDAVAGAWGFQERALITSSTGWGRLQIPCIPPDEYDLKLIVTRKRGVNSLNMGIVVDGRQGMLVFDGWDNRTSCLMLGDGSDPGNNETSVTERKFLKWNKPVTIEVSVRRGAVSAAVNGGKVIQWQGKSSDLFIQSGFYVPNPQTLLIGSWESIFRIDEMTLTAVTGSARRLREEHPADPKDPKTATPR